MTESHVALDDNVSINFNIAPVSKRTAQMKRAGSRNITRLLTAVFQPVRTGKRAPDGELQAVIHAFYFA
ncbi:hypothetical protein ACLB1Q_21705 [Escherichia coli]